MNRLDGYVADIEYVHNFCRELGPAVLNFALTMRGIEPLSPGSGFSHCDIGCGQGLSTNIFASCHPQGEFHAIDFNHAHIQGARELAQKAKLENVMFWEASFDSLETIDLPEFDIITLHGVYSWVNADNRRHIINFIRHKLKPGGIVYASYNCLPGWSATAPIRQLLVASADMTSNNLKGQIDSAIEFVGRLKSMNISYFKNNPSAGDFFDGLSTRSRNYLAHEYFNQHWVPFYHSDVVKDFALASVTFAGSASYANNIDFLNFSHEEQLLLDCIENPVLKETIKDFAVNQQFRKDIFTKGRKMLSPAARQKIINHCRFAIIVPEGKITMAANFPRGEALFEPELYQPVLDAFTKGHYSLENLLQIPAISDFSPDKIYQVLMVLLAAGYILPAVEPSPRALASTRLFNYAILEQMALNTEPQYLVSPVVQSGIQLDWVQRLLLLCDLTDSGDPVLFVSNIMREHNCALIKDGAAIESWDENAEELERQINMFYTDQLPLLKRLEVI